MAVAKMLLSGSVNGKAIMTVTTPAPGTIIHTAPAGTSSFDEVWLWAYIPQYVDAWGQILSLRFGGTTDDERQDWIINTGENCTLVCDGRVLNNGNSIYGLQIDGMAGHIYIFGHVHRHT